MVKPKSTFARRRRATALNGKFVAVSPIESRSSSGLSALIRFETEGFVLIHAYGLFWRRDEVQWNPGRGNRAFRLLGRNGSNTPTLRVVDFRMQVGIYILYGNHGPYYAGLTRAQSLYARLRQHGLDHHGEQWDRFSWFGFKRVLKIPNKDGLQPLAEMPQVRITDPWKIIGDVEALLIKSMALRNKAQMKFTNADEWIQIKIDEAQHYLEKVAR